MTTILSLDTSTSACSVALWQDEKITEKFQLAPRQQAELILPMVAALLKENQVALTDLDAIAFGRGPGSFMGIRLAASVAQGLSLGLDLPIISISSLQALAQEAYDKSGEKNILVGWDARMGAIYWNNYSFPDPVESADQLNDPSSINVAMPCVAAGNAWEIYQEQLNTTLKKQIKEIIPDCYPRASSLAKLAIKKYRENDFVSLEEALPSYVRNEVAKKAKT